MERGNPDEPTDSEQIGRSLCVPQQFALLFERHGQSVFRYLVKRVGSQHAEDLLGETFVTAFQARAGYDMRYPDARPWLFGIATNLAHHFWRSEDRRRRRDNRFLGDSVAHDHGDEVTSRSFFASQEGLVAQALAQLDDAQLDVLLLVAGPGLTYAEVSAALGIPIGTVRSRMSRARQQLRELLGVPEQYLDADALGEAQELANSKDKQ